MPRFFGSCARLSAVPFVGCEGRILALSSRTSRAVRAKNNFDLIASYHVPPTCTFLCAGTALERVMATCPALFSTPAPLWETEPLLGSTRRAR